MAKDEERRARLISVIQHDVKRLDRLITDISNASRLDAELARESLSRVDVERQLSDIVALRRPDRDASRDARAIDIVLRVDGGPLIVRGHESPLSRVFINLVENAATFSPPSGVVTVSARRLPGPHDRIIVTVEDEGPGIPEENLEAIFERFYTRRPDGAAFGAHSGLGLAIARQIVIAHGGRIHAENRTASNGAGAGARFVVDLPADPGA